MNNDYGDKYRKSIRKYSKWCEIKNKLNTLRTMDTMGKINTLKCFNKNEVKEKKNTKKTIFTVKS